MCPHISTVVSDIDRNIAHDADAVTTAQTSYLFPLPEEFELGKPVKLQLGRQFMLPFLQSSGIPLTDSRIPMHPGHVMMDFLACHEERIILQPLSAFLAKSIKGTAVGLSSVCKKSASSFLKELLFEGDYLVIGDVVVRKIRHAGKIRARQKSFLTKSWQIYEEGVSGKCRKTLIRRIAVSGGIQRQDLPDFLP